MKIAIDTSCLLINANCGLSEVVQNLVSELPLVENGNQFIWFYNYFKSKNKIPKNNIYGSENHVLRVPRRIINWLWKLNTLYIDSLLPKADIYHSLHVQIPPSSKLKKVLTVHDCRFLAFPNLYSSHAVESYRALMNISLKRSDMVATVSSFTRQELLNHFAISEDRIKVIYNGFRPYIPYTTCDKKVLQLFTQKLSSPNVYLLFVGVLDPRKNLGRLIEALSILKEEVGDIPELIIAGISTRQWNKSNEAKMAADCGLLKKIHVVGTVEKDILFKIIQKAWVLCYPSLYEGFGFPPLEAMSQGIPVLAGKNSSIPEVTGNAACLVDPLNVDDIAKGLHKVIFDSEYRRKLVKQGFKQIKKFSWPQTASKYISLYKEVLGH